MGAVDININHKYGGLHGFFSCCTIRLKAIYDFLRIEKRLPVTFDYSTQFVNYRSDESSDLESLFFADPNSITANIELYKDSVEWHDWISNFDYLENLKTIGELYQFVDKYFRPSQTIQKVIRDFEIESSIDYSNTVAVCYRGNDKCNETKIASHDVFISKAEDILKENPNVRFLVQTDETEFKDAFLKRFPENSFYNKNLKTMNHTPDWVIHLCIDKSERTSLGVNILAMVNVMSKCKWLITHTGNCSFWIVLYRKNFDRVYQMINNKWTFKEHLTFDI
jgi:hypothetical protein